MNANAASPEQSSTPVAIGLPHHGSTFIGRTGDIEAVTEMLGRGDIRLLTLLGPGGIGKTRLATEVASRMSHDGRRMVRWVSLETVTEHSLLGVLIAKSLRVELPRGNDAILALVRILDGTDILLILDNLEHLPDASLTIARLLAHTESLTILATSRAPLDIRGEHRYPLPPLDILPADRPTSPSALARIESTRLFIARAKSVNPAFATTHRNAATIAAICRKVDGLPLAIELAAAQTAVLTPDALLERIESFRPLPVTGPRDAPDRLRTMHNAISWSHDLLSENGKVVFRRLSVFRGSFSLDAAESLGLVAVDDEDNAFDFMRGISELVGHSLLRQVARDGDARFMMLRTIHHFANERLIDAGELQAVEAAHADISLEFAEQMMWAWLTGRGSELDRLESDHPNLLAALDWYRQEGDGNHLVRLAIALTGFWYANTLDHIALRWLTHALEYERSVPPSLRGRLHIAYGMVLGVNGDLSHASDWITSGLALLDQPADIAIRVLALVWQGAIARTAGDFGLAEQTLEEALRIAEGIEAPDLRAALRARALSNLGVNANEQGDFTLATERYDAALRIYKSYGPLPGMIRVYADRGITACNQGDFDTGMRWFRDCLRLPAARTDRRLLAPVLEWTALIAMEWHQPVVAFRFLGALESMRHLLGESDQVRGIGRVHDRLLPVLDTDRRPGLLQQARKSGREMSPGDVIALVLDLQPSPSGERDHTTRDIIFTGREYDVLRLLVHGKSNREIAAELFLSIRTVEGHVAHICRKLGVQTRTSAVAVALANRLVALDQSTG